MKVFSGRKLAEILENKGWTKAQFVRKIHRYTDEYAASEAYVGKLINETIKSRPSLDYVSMMANVLGVEIEALTEEKDDEKR